MDVSYGEISITFKCYPLSNQETQDGWIGQIAVARLPLQLSHVAGSRGSNSLLFMGLGIEIFGKVAQGGICILQLLFPSSVQEAYSLPHCFCKQVSWK